MFYVKAEIAEGCELRIDITDENVFTTCPECGTEIEVDIAELLETGECDMYSTQIYCSECSIIHK